MIYSGFDLDGITIGDSLEKAQSKLNLGEPDYKSENRKYYHLTTTIDGIEGESSLRFKDEKLEEISFLPKLFTDTNKRLFNITAQTTFEECMDIIQKVYQRVRDFIGQTCPVEPNPPYGVLFHKDGLEVSISFERDHENFCVNTYKGE